MKTFPHVRYTYLRDNNRNPHSCVAVRLDRNSNIIRYQIASLNRKKDPFIKIRARFIACQRLNKKPFEISTNLLGLSAHEITKIIMTDIVSRTDHYIADTDIVNDCEIVLKDEHFVKGLPQQARKAAKRWLKKHEVISLNKSSNSRTSIQNYSSALSKGLEELCTKHLDEDDGDGWAAVLKQHMPTYGIFSSNAEMLGEHAELVYDL